MSKELDAARDQRMTEMHEEFVAETKETRESFRRQLADLRETFEKQLSDLKKMLDERYANQTKAIETAFGSAEKAVNVALVNAEKAVTKAENAADKRFEAINEFREQLADQSSTFLTRIEYDTAHANLVQRFEGESKRLTDRLSEHEQAETIVHQEMQKPHEEIMRTITALDSKTSSRLDLLAGQTIGNDEAQAQIASITTRRNAVLGLMISGIVIVMNLIFFLIINYH